jgi:hypothetical protein
MRSLAASVWKTDPVVKERGIWRLIPVESLIITGSKSVASKSPSKKVEGRGISMAYSWTRERGKTVGHSEGTVASDKPPHSMPSIE